MWQDYIISSVLVLFSYALILQVIHGFKNKKATILLQTGIITTMGLYIFVFIFFTLNLFFSAFLNLIMGNLWFILTLQKASYG